MIPPTVRAIVMLAIAAGPLFAQRGGRAAAAPAPAPQPSGVLTVRGTVYDSLHGGAMKGALVSLPNAGRSTTTDSVGRFAIDSVRPGRHVIHVSHEGLDSLGLHVLTADATILPSSPALTLAIPTYRSFWRAACDRPPPGDSVYISGVVRNAADDTPVANATVRLVWILTSANVDLENKMDGVTATTDENGAYGFCGVPKNANLRLRAATDRMESGTFAMPAGRADVRWRDLVVAGVGSDSTTLGTVSGVVRQRGTGAPVVDGRIVIDGTIEVRTDSAGRFRANGVQPGTRQVAVLSVGVAAATATVDIRPGRINSVTLSVEQVQTLAAANIVTRGPPSPIVQAIMERRRVGLGRYVDSTALVGRYFTRSIFEQAQGLRVLSTAGGVVMVNGRALPRRPFIVLAKDVAGRDCMAEVLIDGIRSFDQDELLSIPPDEIALVEMYARPLLVPAEFQQARQECGLIAVWTRYKVGERKSP